MPLLENGIHGAVRFCVVLHAAKRLRSKFMGWILERLWGCLRFKKVCWVLGLWDVGASRAIFRVDTGFCEILCRDHIMGPIIVLNIGSMSFCGCLRMLTISLPADCLQDLCLPTL